MRSLYVILFGIMLPCVALLVEFAAGMCAGVFFDPIPTLWHVLLVGYVPLANAVVLIGVDREWSRHRKQLLWLNGVAIGISLVYSLVFLPITPMAFLAILGMGMGLLPLSPLLSFIAALWMRKAVVALPAGPADSGKAAVSGKRPGDLVSLLGGSGLGILMLVLLELPVPITHIGIELAMSRDASDQARGVSILRRFSSQEYLLQMCYNDGAQYRRMSSFLVGRVSRETAQKAFFRMTGQPYNAFPRGRKPSGFIQTDPFDDFDFDPDVGGMVVGGRRKGLTLENSRLDAKILSEEATAYLEWTLVFKNVGRDQKEARAQIRLPPDGVVSRLTLWVNGEPREAAFAATGQVREAYQKVAVVQRRDPVLVTWVGPDRVLMQCFPVPPNGGQMKVRLGITAPLHLQTLDKAALALPCFVERNFGIEERDVHAVWAESDGPIACTLRSLQPEKGTPQTLRGTLSEQALTSPEATVAVTRSNQAAETRTPDLLNREQVIAQEVMKTDARPADAIIVVVDGSVAMVNHLGSVAKALESLSSGVPVKLLVAGDKVVDLTRAATRPGGWELLAEQLRAAASPGGCDNVPSLLQAWDLAPKAGQSAIIWLHASQPVLLSSIDSLSQRFSWRPDQTSVYDLQVDAGPNRVLESLKDAPSVRPVPRLGSVEDDLRIVLRQLTGTADRPTIHRKQVAAGDDSAAAQASSHVARLWAWERVAELWRTGKAKNREEAVQLAVSYRLVTPVTGAVVLENQQQYDEAKLTPVAPDSVPTIPEPESWLLMAMALVAVLWLARRRSPRRAVRPTVTA